MAGSFASRRGAALYLLAWLMLGLLLAALVAGSGGAGWINSLLFAMPLTLVYAFATGFSAYYLCRAFPIERVGGVSILAVFCVTALLASAMWSALAFGWNALLQALALPWAGVALTPSLGVQMFALGVMLYGVAAVANYLAIEVERARRAERRELESQLMAQDAELRLLRTQIDPHFLFNSLNSISALTSIDPAGAREMTLRLADFFRHSLGLEAHRKVPLSAEASLVQHFLAIEQVRFGSRLKVEQNIDRAARDCLLPPMILQPLVENAVKHGIGNLTEGGTVRIAATRAASLLRITVENDVDADARPSAASGNGIGLANVRQRLEAMYGHQANITWSRRGHLFRVELTLPAETEIAACV